jgi:uncharacterized protein (DUF488 family)
VYSIGHSTRSLAELVALLRENGVATLADVRRFPGSRRYPHFGRDALAGGLQAAGIRYEHFEVLGGRRKPLQGSPNGGWRNDQFRGYADHMGTAEFAQGVDRLLSLPSPCVMCAEAVPWRCHRNLLSDELTRRGIEVVHILGPGKTARHELNPMARDGGDRVIYPPGQGQGTLGFGGS